MADKEPMIVVKKITVVQAGAHGGSWKVAFADFMTAMMAFFLVMWLLGQSEEVKENVSDYFSTPSIIEYNFSNYGVELTLEKLFMDLMNEPLAFFETFMKPMDHTPNIMTLGTKKVVLFHLADQLGDLGQNVTVHESDVTFDIPAKFLFQRGKTDTNASYVSVMEKITGITAGIEDSDIFVESQIYDKAVGTRKGAGHVAQKRLDIITRRIESGLESETVDLYKKYSVDPFRAPLRKDHFIDGIIKFKIEQKEFNSQGNKPRKIKQFFGEGDESLSAYNNFVKRVSGRPAKKPKRSKIKSYPPKRETSGIDLPKKNIH